MAKAGNEVSLDAGRAINNAVLIIEGAGYSGRKIERNMWGIGPPAHPMRYRPNIKHV